MKAFLGVLATFLATVYADHPAPYHPAPYHPAPYHPAPVYKPAPAPYKPAPAPYKPAPVAYKPAPVAYKPAPAPYKPAPAPYKPAPYKPAHYESYEDEPVYRCPNYPYCDDAPYALSHLQYEIEALRQRAALIDAHGAALAQQEPNRPFVGGVYY